MSATRTLSQLCKTTPISSFVYWIYIYIYVYIYMYVYEYIYIYICVCVCVDGVIYLVVVFTAGLWLLKCSKWLICCISCWYQQKPSNNWAKYLSASERPHLFLRTWDRLGPWAIISKIPTLENRVRRFFYWLSSFTVNSAFFISQTVTPRPISCTIFWKISIRISDELIDILFLYNRYP